MECKIQGENCCCPMLILGMGHRQMSTQVGDRVRDKRTAWALLSLCGDWLMLVHRYGYLRTGVMNGINESESFGQMCPWDREDNVIGCTGVSPPVQASEHVHGKSSQHRQREFNVMCLKCLLACDVSCMSGHLSPSESLCTLSADIDATS